MNYWSAPFLIQNRHNVWNVDQDILEVVQEESPPHFIKRSNCLLWNTNSSKFPPFGNKCFKTKHIVLCTTIVVQLIISLIKRRVLCCEGVYQVVSESNVTNYCTLRQTNYLLSASRQRLFYGVCTCPYVQCIIAIYNTYSDPGRIGVYQLNL